MFRLSSARLARGLVAVVGAAALGIGTASVALAYPSPGSTVTLLSGCNTITAGNGCTFTWYFALDTGGAFTNDPVSFTTTCPGTLSPTSGTTDAVTGQISTVLTTTTSSKSGPCSITVNDTSAETDTATVTITFVPPATGGLPATGTAPPGASPWLYVIFGFGALIVVGGAVALRRTGNSVV